MTYARRAPDPGSKSPVGYPWIIQMDLDKWTWTKGVSNWTWTEACPSPVYPVPSLEQGADTLWLKHATSACRALKEVYFEFEPATSHDTLIEFFRRAQHLTKLTLRESVNPVLSNTLIKVFMSLPKLEVSELNYPITLAMVKQIKGALPIVPSIRELNLTFSEGAGTAPSILLEGLHTLRQLEISLGNSTSNWFYDTNTSVFKAFARLESLQSLVVWVHPGLHITDAEITALTSLESLRCLEIYQMTDTSSVDEDGQDRAWRSALQTTAESLTEMLVRYYVFRAALLCAFLIKVPSLSSRFPFLRSCLFYILAICFPSCRAPRL